MCCLLPESAIIILKCVVTIYHLVCVPLIYTIRSTPDKPVHCIVFAKELYKLLFGISSESMLYEDPTASQQELSVVASNNQNQRRALTPASFTREGILDHFVQILIEHNTFDIEQKISIGQYKTSMVQPAPLAREIIYEAQRHVAAEGCTLPSHTVGWDRAVFSTEENLRELLSVAVDIYLSVYDSQSNQLVTRLEFDKDDKFAMRFVACAANLRASIFAIPMLSLYDAKGVAGNIIPAISSTNAIIAGLQVGPYCQHNLHAILFLKRLI